MGPQVRAPWTEDQMESLKDFQDSPYWHAFTCGKCGAFLKVVTGGFVCPWDDYDQDWAHEFMTDWSWKRTVEPAEAGGGS